MPKESQTVDYVKEKVLFDHCKSSDTQEFAIESAALKVNVTRNFGKRGNAYVCHRCKKPGHFRKDCHVKLPSNGSSDGVSNNLRAESRRFNNNPGRGNCGIPANVASNLAEVSEETEISTVYVNVMSSELVTKNRKSRQFEIELELIWVLDSGCTDHMVNTDKYFYHKVKLKYPVNVKLADGFIIKATYIGHIRVRTIDEDGKEKLIDIRNVYFASELGGNLLSFDLITKAGFSILAEGNTAKIRKSSGGVIGTAIKNNKLYELFTFVREDVTCSAIDVSENVAGLGNAKKWHRMLGHVNYKDLNILSSKQLLDGLPKQLGKESGTCNTCLENKFCNSGHRSVRTRAEKILELVHSDVNFVSPTGNKGEIGFVSFIDDFSQLTRIYCIKSKSEVASKFMHFVDTMSNLTNCNVKTIRCDRGTEYLNKHFEDFCSSKGIITLNPSPAYVHKLNGTAKRYNRTILDRTRCLLSDAGIEKR